VSAASDRAGVSRRGATAFVVSFQSSAQTRITDASGRGVALPAKIERVYAAGPPASVLVVAIAPEKLIGWFDAPPGLNRLLGVQWLTRIFYPKLFPEPLGPRITAFHRLYYHREPTDTQVRALLETAGLSR
jgi:ABC-type Fe3+-hydroxamate transport system substrate-binding protein